MRNWKFGWQVLALLLASTAAAQNARPPGAPLLGDQPLTPWRLSGRNGTAAQVEAAGPGFTRAWRVQTRADTSPPWAIELKAPVARAVARGDVALLHFFARAVATTDESAAAYLRVVVQKASADWAKSIETTLSLSRDWQEFFLPFSFAGDYTAQGVEVAFGVGFKQQTVELGGFDFVHYGRTVALSALPRTRLSYRGREPDAVWRKTALARIEQVRKGDFTIEVVDAAGRPVPEAAVRVEQKKAAFQFGSAFQLARLVNDSEDNRIYRAKTLELFNAGSPENDLKWPGWIGEWGRGYDRTQTLAGLTWLRQHGLSTRGHVLIWPGWKNLPRAIRDLRGTPRQSEIPVLALAHIADEVGELRELIDEWDVLNEPYTNHDLMDLFGPAIQADWFRAARAAHPAAALFLNDYSNHDASLDAGHVAAFEATAHYLQAQSAPLGGLGVQAHISAHPSPPASILAVLDRYAKLALPVRITEFDVNTDDEELQADYTRDFLIAVFSHPSVVGFQMWGFWEGAHWIPRGAMYRRDWTAKPNAQAYRSLVLEQWRTRATGKTDAQGGWTSRAFFGDYVASIDHAGLHQEARFTVAPGGNLTRVRVTLPADRTGDSPLPRP